MGGKYYCNQVNDWLAKIRNSTLIVTDSFHCVCFAIFFENNFIYVTNDSRGLPRLENLLSSLGLSNRIPKGDLKKHYLSLCNTKIDFKKINDSLERNRKLSIDFLREALT